MVSIRKIPAVKVKGSKLKRPKHVKVKLTTIKQQETVADDNDCWYCAVYRTDDQLNMTKCVGCGVWLHNECVGLESDVEDDEPFLCPDCNE